MGHHPGHQSQLLGPGRVHPVARVPDEVVDERGRRPEHTEDAVATASLGQQFLDERAKVCRVALSRQGFEDADESEQRLVGVRGVADGLEKTVREPLDGVAVVAVVAVVTAAGTKRGQGRIGEVTDGAVGMRKAEPGEGAGGRGGT